MNTEEKIVKFICDTKFSDIPSTALKIIKKQVLTIIGTTIGGSSADGCETVMKLAKELGGKEEASILIYGGKVPAQQAAFVNGTMARALDFCDALEPGPHIGAATVASALAAAELKGGCSGEEFLTAITVGAEVAVRLNLSEAQYGGFNPTGVLVVFSATAASAKILGFSEMETWNAMGLAFNKCGGSFQSHIDGSLGVRINEGWIAETGITCARLARHRITGPKNFLEGIYGYFHLFGRDQVTGETVTAGLGATYNLDKLVFKLFPSCALTQLSTEVILNLIEKEKLEADDIKNISVVVPPYAYNLVGSPFKVGSNPKVNAQFSIRYCVANALMRKSSLLTHFEEDTIKNPMVLEIAEKVNVIADPEMNKRGHTALDMTVLLNNGKKYLEKSDIAPGFPGRPLTDEQHKLRFLNCVDFSGKPFFKEKAESIIARVDSLETMNDIRSLINMLIIKG
jgi:2-methylcitrate dehydratase PrpD